ncbi:MAG: 3-isopropylmalate dehydratase large subunit [Candidatus Pacebacteria bacterium]|nr:3-isopropylmalate dehydratase large subunit [Candidatus Paceibacterota bacterium]
MSEKTAFQKIIEEHLMKTFSDGRMALRLDWVWGHEITTPNAILDMKARGCDVVFDPNKIKTMIDHVNPANDTASATQGKIIREWSGKHDIEFLDVGRNGICHAIIPEKGWIFPGQIGIMGDSHTCTHGAFCSFTIGVGTTDLENGIISGLWICPPQKVIRVNFNGKLPANVFSKDLILSLINKIGVKGATNAVLEFGGTVIDEMSMEGRMTIANMAIEAGATSGMMMIDRRTLEYLWPAVVKKYNKEISFDQALADLQRFNSDEGAAYDQVIEINVSDMVPVITNNYSPGDVVNVSELIGKKIDQVYIGSCTNGRIEDLRIAAGIFSQLGGKVADNVRCIIVPATRHIYERALKEGLLETFIKTGCFVSGPTCGACLGMSCGILAPGEVCVSTTNRNFPGRMGEGGMVHLSSPAVAALSAIKGKISEPTIEMCDRAREDNQVIGLSEKEAVRSTDWKEKVFEEPDYGSLLELTDEKRHKDFSGKVFYLPFANIDTDQIIPAKYLTETKKSAFGKHCLEAVQASSIDRSQIYVSQVIVAGENFGSGSSREHAVWALESAGIKCVVAPSFARIFETNMFTNGLLCITLSKEIIDSLFSEKPKELLIDWEKGIVKWNAENSAKFEISEYQKDLIRSGGSVGMMLNLASELQIEKKQLTK